MGVFTPFAALYYSVLLKIKFRWFSRIKTKKIKVAKSFLYDKLMNGEIKESCVEEIIKNYLNFGDRIFNRKLLQNAFSMNRSLTLEEQKTRKKRGRKKQKK